MKIMVHLGVKKAIRGAIAGLAIALLIIFFQNTYLFIPLPPKIYFIDYLPMKFKINDFLLILIMVSSFIFFSSYFVARKIVGLKLTKALKWMK